MDIRKRVLVGVLCLYILIGTYAHEVLYLNSYHIGYTWSEEVTAGVRSVFDSIESVELFVEYLDTKAGYSEDRMKLHLEMLTTKYHQHKFKLILISDNNALDFVLKYREHPILNAPIVFCGISDLENYPIADNRIWGVEEKIDFKAMFEIVNELLPMADTIHVVVDKTKTGRVFYAKFLEIAKSKILRTGIRFVEEVDTKKMDSLVGGIPNTDAIFYGGVHIDANGNRVNTHTIVSQIAKHTSVPIFTYPFFIPNEGVAGGILSLGREQGKQMALLAYKVMYMPGSIKEKIIQPQNRLVFDYSELEKYTISNSAIPDDAIILGKPKSIFNRYKQQFFTALSIIVFLSFLILILTRIILLKNKYYNELMEAKKYAERSDELKSKFLRNLSHEIRTPLNAIIGFSGLLDAEFDNEEIRRVYLDKIQVSGEQLTGMIDDTLTLAKLEVGEYEVDTCQFSFKELFAQLKQLVINKDSTTMDRVEVSGVLDDLCIKSDLFIIVQVLEKLIDNALRHNEEGKIKVKVDTSNNQTVFMVQDNGPGIKKEIRDEIFLTFNKIENGYVFHQGLGTGLSISKQFAVLLNGNISFESAEEIGTTFYFTLPVQAFKPIET